MQDYDEYCDNEGQNNEYQAEELNDTDYEVESNDLRLWCLTQLSTIFQLYRG
jgi:hypothetical protein